MELPFLKKQAVTAGRGAVPVERVKELSSKGFSELETIDVLRKEGYSAEEVEKGMTQAFKAGVTTEPVQPLQEAQKLPTLEDIVQKTEMPQVPETSLPQEYSQGYSPEEYINYVVEERVGEANVAIDDISEKIRELEKKVERMCEQVNILAQSKTSEQPQIMEKIDGLKEAVSNMELKLAGLEKAFREILPALIESVRMLSDLAQRVKKEA